MKMRLNGEKFAWVRNQTQTWKGRNTADRTDQYIFQWEAGFIMALAAIIFCLQFRNILGVCK